MAKWSSRSAPRCPSSDSTCLSKEFKQVIGAASNSVKVILLPAMDERTASCISEWCNGFLAHQNIRKVHFGESHTPTRRIASSCGLAPTSHYALPSNLRKGCPDGRIVLRSFDQVVDPRNDEDRRFDMGMVVDIMDAMLSKYVRMD